MQLYATCLITLPTDYQETYAREIFVVNNAAFETLVDRVTPK
jgi:hypothetical protein